MFTNRLHNVLLSTYTSWTDAKANTRRIFKWFISSSQRLIYLVFYFGAVNNSSQDTIVNFIQIADLLFFRDGLVMSKLALHIEIFWLLIMILGWIINGNAGTVFLDCRFNQGFSKLPIWLNFSLFLKILAKQKTSCSCIRSCINTACGSRKHWHLCFQM